MRKSIFLLILTLSTTIFSFFQFEVIETTHARIFYTPKYEKIAQYVATVFENRREEIIDLIGNKETERVNFLIADAGILTNGFTEVINKKITLFTFPPSELLITKLPVDSWYEILVVHEYTHFVHLTYESGFPKIVDGILFGSPILNPQIRSMFVESTTLFDESHFSPYQGRLNYPPTHEGLISSMIKGNWFPNEITLKNIPSDYFLNGELYYLVPATFYEFLSKEYGHEKVKEFLKTYSSQIFGYEGFAMKKVFKKDLKKLFNEWKKYWKEKTKHYHNQGKELISLKNFAIYNFYIENNKIYFYGRRYTPINSLSNKFVIDFYVYDMNKKNIKKIFEANKIASFSKIMVKDNNLYYLTIKRDLHRTSQEKMMHYNYALLMRKNLKTKKEKVLYKGLISTYTVKNDDEIYYSVYNPFLMKSEIYKNENKIFELKGFVREMDLRKNKLLLVSLKEGHSGIVGILNLKDGKYEEIIKDSFLKSSVNFMSDSEIIFCAPYEKGYNDVYTFDLNGRNLKKLTQNSVFTKVIYYKGKLYALGYSEKQPAISIYEVEPKTQTYQIKRIEKKREEFKNVAFKKENGDLAYMEKFLKPIIRFPYLNPNFEEESMDLGYGFVNSTIDDSIILVNIPYLRYFYSQNEYDFGIVNALNLKTNYFSLFLSSNFNFTKSNMSFFGNFAIPLFEFGENIEGSSYSFTNLEFKIDNMKNLELVPGFEITEVYGSKNFQISMTFPLTLSSTNLIFDNLNLGFNFSTILFENCYAEFGAFGKIQGKEWKNKDIYAKFGENLISIRKGIWIPYMYLNDLYVASKFGFEENFVPYITNYVGLNLYSYQIYSNLKLGFTWFPLENKIDWYVDFGGGI